MIGVVILNYNSYVDTIKLVTELQKQTVNKDLQIVVVDNSSPNKSYEKLKSLKNIFSNVVILKTNSNLGYAKANNFGLNYLDKHFSPEYVAILNNDIKLSKNSFEKLYKKYKLLENPAIIAPKQLDIYNNEILPYKLNTFVDDCLNMFFIFKIFYKRNALNYIDNTNLKAMKVPMIPGSFMFTSFKIFKDIGYFYPNTFLFAEERFIAVKVKDMKLNNYILLDQTYVHAHSKTINTVFSIVQKNKLLYDSWLEFTRVCRRNGRIKSVILRQLMKLSLMEIRLVYKIKGFFNK